MGYPKSKFNIQIFNVRNLIKIMKRHSFDCYKGEDGLYHAKEGTNFLYTCDYLRCSTFESIDENALFLQIAYTKNFDGISEHKEKKIVASLTNIQKNIYALNPENYRSYRDVNVSLPEIVYLDFNAEECVKSDNGTMKKEAVISYYKNEIEALFNDGFIVKGMNDKVIFHYRPFDKSASMGRRKMISFLSDYGYSFTKVNIPNFSNIIKERVHLGLNAPQYDSGKLVLAKKYAYRGLMMSGGFRVEMYQIRKLLPDFVLNEKTVLIVPDQELSIKSASYYTQKPKGQKELKDDTHFYVEFEDKTEHIQGVEKKGVNMNDGYGLIDKTLADAISKILKYPSPRTTFQIRLPFVKGLVHVVDFKSFLKEKALKDGKVSIRAYNDNLDKLGEDEVREFTLEELDKIQLILTESTFKCISELRYFHKDNIDKAPFNNGMSVMEFYWSQFRKYHHCLYIVSANKAEEGMTKLNYQFLSTAGLSIEQFEKLYKRSEDAALSLIQDDEARIAHFLNDEDDEEEVINESDSGERDVDFNEDKHLDEKLRLFQIKPEKFINEPYYKNLLEEEIESMIKGFGKGNILIEGQDRFLAGDILSFLYWLSGSHLPEELKISCGGVDRFIAPGIQEFNAIDGRRYAVLRNPHLSRNEDLTLVCYIPEEGSERNKYGLDQLTGVCMIDPTDSSLPADTIGGADYDGDHVKVIINEDYAKALYEHRDDALVIGDEHKALATKTSDDFIDNTLNQFKVNLSTFDNSVGMISNLALKEAIRAYTEKSLESDEQLDVHADRVRLLGIFTGLETDSAKTGIKPYFKGIESAIDKEAVINKGKVTSKVSAQDLFISFKNYLKNGLSSAELKEKFKNKFELFFNPKDLQSYSEEFFESVGRYPNNVELLIPKYYALNKTLKDTRLAQRKPRQQDVDLVPGYRPVEEGLNQEILKQVKSWITSYNTVIGEINNRLRMNASNFESDFYKNILLDDPIHRAAFDEMIALLSDTNMVSDEDFNELYEQYPSNDLVSDLVRALMEEDKDYFNKQFSYILPSGMSLPENFFNALFSRMDEYRYYNFIYMLKEAKYRRSESERAFIVDDADLLDKYFNISTDDSLNKKSLENFTLSLMNSNNLFKSEMKELIKKALVNAKAEYRANAVSKVIKDALRNILKEEKVDGIDLDKLVDNFKNNMKSKVLSRNVDIESISPLFNEVRRVFVQALSKPLISYEYGLEININDELLKDVNNYRYTLFMKAGDKYLTIKHELETNCQEDQKRFVLNFVKTKIEGIFRSEPKKNAVKYVRAVQESVDKNQSFLFKAYLNEWLEIVEELNND